MMTVGELIEKLSRLDPSERVLLYDDERDDVRDVDDVIPKIYAESPHGAISIAEPSPWTIPPPVEWSTKQGHAIW